MMMFCVRAPSLATLALALAALASRVPAQGRPVTEAVKPAVSADQPLAPLIRTPPAQPEHQATLIGAVIDSVHGGMLVGATVSLNGTPLSTITDAQGRFRLDTIPPGTYQITVSHPLLDTLGFAIGTQPLRMGPDSVQQVILATPSPQTIVATKCTEAKRRLGPGAILGTVTDPDTHVPLDSVRVSFVWSELTASKDIGIGRMEKVREARSDADGNFTICGVPPRVSGTIRADRGKAQTAEVPVAMEESPLVLQSLSMLEDAGRDTNMTPLVGKAVLTGRITDTTGQPVAGAHVTVQGARSMATSGIDGRFRITDLPSGTRAVAVRQIGYSPGLVPVDLSASAPAEVAIALSKSAPTLDPVAVRAPMETALEKNGFTLRRRMGMGHYLGPKDIERRLPQRLSSLFPMIPGFTTGPGVGTGQAITSVRDGCVAYWVDGIQYTENRPGELDYQIQVQQLMAIETYSAASAPMQFRVSGSSSCSVVLIWTNRMLQQK